MAGKLGLEGPGATFEEVTFAVAIQSPASPEQVRKLIAYGEQSLRKPIPVHTVATLNGQVLAL